ncbi:LAGLIDADG family homing endonuclease [Metabacillus mangrovi]|nr:LAGLIDADG family homing endonuclease [Metabacillus mangrovi]
MESGKKKGKLRKRTMEIEEMIRLYREGTGTREIAEAENVSPNYVRLVFKDHNVQLRPFGHSHRKYRLNEHYFKTWSNNMAYILGFFYADGFVASKQQTVSFAQKDPMILEQIREEMQSEAILCQNKKTGVYILNLNSKIMREDLINLFGVSSKKSVDAVFPTIPEEYLHHFIRGYFDGDGNINYRGYFINFVGGSFDFMSMLKITLEKQGFEPVFKTYNNHYRVYVSGRKTIKQFADWIYSDKGIYLERKFETFQQEKLPIEQLQNKRKNSKINEGHDL